jgi:hypothetical protein
MDWAWSGKDAHPIRTRMPHRRNPLAQVFRFSRVRHSDDLDRYRRRLATTDA